MGRTNYNGYSNQKTDNKMFDQKTDAFKNPVKTVYGRVDNCEAVYLRAQPNKESKDITVLQKGAEVTIVDVLDGWYKVEVESLAGFVMKDYIKLI